MQLSVLFVVLAVMLIFILSCSAAFDRKKIANASDFLLHGQSLKLGQLVSTLVAANLSLGNMIFVCGIFGYSFAWSGVFWMAATITALVAGFLCFARNFKAYIESKNNFGSIHDFIARAHGADDELAKQKIRKIAAAISSLSLFLAIIVEVHLAATFVSTITGLSQEFVVSVVMIFVCIFSAVGGFRSVVITDIIQGALLILSIIAGALLFNYYVPIGGKIHSLDYRLSSLIADVGPYSPVGLLILGGGWLLTTPDTWQRNCCARRYDISVRGAVIGGAIMVLAVSCFSIAGLIVKNVLEQSIKGDTRYSNGSFPISDIFLISSDSISVRILLSIMAIGLLMAAISTINTFIVVISHAISVDFLPDMKRFQSIPETDPSSRRLIARARVIMIFTGVLAMIFWSLIHDKFIHDPINIFFVTYSVQFSLLIAVLTAGVPNLRNPFAAKFSIIVSSAMTVVFGATALTNGSEILFGLSGSDWLSLLPAFTVITGAMAFIVGLLISGGEGKLSDRHA